MKQFALLLRANRPEISTSEVCFMDRQQPRVSSTDRCRYGLDNIRSCRGFAMMHACPVLE